MLPDYHEELRDGRTVVICDRCGAERHSGDWPDCRKDGSHSKGSGYDDALEPYFDHGLGAYITTRGERRKLISQKGLEDFKSERRKSREAGRIYVDLRRS